MSWEVSEEHSTSTFRFNNSKNPEGGGIMLLYNNGIYQSTWCNISET